MSTGDEDLLRNVTREVLADLLPGLFEEELATPATNGNGNEHFLDVGNGFESEDGGGQQEAEHEYEHGW